MNNLTLFQVEFQQGGSVNENGVAKVDFWEKMFQDNTLQWVLGPVLVISIIVQIPAYIGILHYIKDRHIK